MPEDDPHAFLGKRWSQWWSKIKQGWKNPEIRGVLIVAVAGAFMGGFGVGRATAPSQSIVINTGERRGSVTEKPTEEQARRAWPPLTNQQIEEWVKILHPYKIKTLWIYRLDEIEARELYLSLAKIGNRLSIPVQAVTGTFDADFFGIDIDVQQNDPVGPIIVELLQKDGYPARLIKGGTIYQDNTVAVGIGPKR